MNKRGMLIGIVAVAIGAGLVAMLLARGNKPTPPAALPVPAATANVEEPAAPVEITPSQAPAPDAPTPSQPPRKGSGRIYGVATMPEEAGDLAISITLNFIKDGDTINAGNGPMVIPPTDGKFDITGLVSGDYELAAVAPGFGVNTSVTLTPAKMEKELSMALVPVLDISGHVRNTKGEPVDGAQVFLSGWKMGQRERKVFKPRAAVSRQITDATGAFSMKNLTPGPKNERSYRFTVRAEGYAPLLTDYLSSGTNDVTLVVKQGAVVSGMLVSAETGDPLPDREVTLEEIDSLMQTPVRTDAGGFFFLHDVAPGEQTARLLDKDLVLDPTSARFTVAEGAPTEEVVLRAASGGRITGRVYDQDSGKGIAGVKVSASVENASDGKDNDSVTDAAGAFVLSGLETATYQVDYETPEGYPQNSTRRMAANLRMVVVQAGREMSNVDFALQHGLQIRGRVEDESGKPIAQAQVHGFASRGMASDFTQSKTDGTFVLSGYSAGQRVQISASQEGLTLMKMEPAGEEVAIQSTSVDGVRLVLGAESTISGIVVDEQGRPKRGIYMSADIVGNDNGGSGGQSEDDGKITISGLRPGSYRLSFQSDMPSSAEVTVVKVAKGEKVTGLRFVMPSAGAFSIAGRVEDTRGKPIANAQISFMGGMAFRDAESDAAGNFVIDGLKEGKAQLSVSHSDYSNSPQIVVTAGARDLKIVLKDHAVIEGRVISASTGQPVTAFEVSAGPESTGFGNFNFTPSFNGTPVQDADGHFRLDVEDGTASVQVQAVGYALAKVSIPKVSGGETRRDVLVRLNAGATLAGRVVEASGQPVPGAQVYLGPVPGPWADFQAAPATTSADGSFQLTSLTPGAIEVSATHPNFAPKSVHTNVVAGGTNRVDIVMSGGGTIEGVVTLDGRPVANQHISAMTMNKGAFSISDEAEGETDAAGRYRITGLGDGLAHVSVDLDSGGTSRMQSHQATVKEGTVAQVNFAFLSGGATLEGTIFEAEGVPMRESVNIEVSVVNTTEQESFSTQSDADGRYIVEGLPAGLAHVQLDMDASAKSITVQVGANERVRRDIFLFAGATIHVEVTGIPENTPIVPVVLMSGKFDAGTLSMEDFATGMPEMAGMAVAMGGEAVLKGIEPGVYTVIAIMFDPAHMTSPDDPLSMSNMHTQVVEVKKDDKDLSVKIDL